MKKLSFFPLMFLLFLSTLSAQDLVTSVEAEAGVLTGVNIAPQTGASSGPYVTGFDADGDKVTVNVTVPAAANYKLEIRYRAAFGAKAQDVYANGNFVANVNFPMVADFVDLNAGSIFLNAGANTITVQKSWGYMDVDKFTIYTLPKNVFNIAPSLIDPQANAATNALYSFLLSQFGKRVITGQTDGYYDEIKTLTGKSPLLRAWDMASYSPMYAYKWGGSGHVFGAVDNQDAEKAIAWYNSTSKKGIVSFHWHWHSPSGSTPGRNTFYTDQTSFDVSQAVISGTQQNTDVLRDIDAIAVQLKKLRDADVPVLWRPLHEAGGGWFWWGAKGAAPAKALWDIMYDRLTNFHGLHNLIWSWSSPEADWYPGNSKVDMIGYDSYPGNYNYTIQKNVFDNLFTITGGQKLIAMTENGPIPDIQNAISADAPWSYFMSWNDLVFQQNSNQHIIDVYTNPLAITLENISSILPIKLSSFKGERVSDKNHLYMDIASAENLKTIYMERSSNATDFSELKAISTAWNSIAGKHVYIDESPLKGANYYRLKIVDNDGKVTYSGVVRLTNNKLNFTVRPNPFTDYVLVHIEGGKYNVRITDQGGKTVLSRSVQGANPQDVKLSLGNLARGVYYVTVTDDSGTTVGSEKLVK
jgi:mannan endo-1,4-beta-mannosidase